jgi:phosphoenolpyruvate carboxylase
MTPHRRTIGEDTAELRALLWRVIGEQETEAARSLVEQARRGAIAYREGEAPDRADLDAAIDACGPAERETLARAFTAYFELVNLAEERQRVRTVRADGTDGPPEDSLASTAAHLAEAGVDPEEVAGLLEAVELGPTFTAHPTEARRKTVKRSLRRVAGVLAALDERRLTDAERQGLERELAAAVTTLWGTARVRRRPPEPIDEARNVQYYLDEVLFDVVPEVYEGFADALAERYDDPPELPRLLRFRSWAGSDRDGNPFVTTETTTRTLERQRRLVLDRYDDALADLAGVLTQDVTQVETTTAFDDALVAAEAALPGGDYGAAARHEHEPYRRFAHLLRERVDRVDDVRPGGYRDADALLSDLETLAADLRANGLATLAETHVAPLIRRVDTFGFHFAALDLRDHQKNHTATVAEALAREGIDYEGMDETERVTLLTEAIEQDDPVVDVTDREGCSETTARVLERFDRLADWQREFGVDAIDTYCISMAEEPSHVLEVLFLADQAGVVDLPGHSGLDVVPLLETAYALDRARDILGTLYENDAYAANLAARGDRQEVMLGYSDSNQENGFLAANWSLQRNARRLAEIADDYDVALRLFHGRGGSISRGGGPMNDALKALPPETATGEVRFTEQGEAIAEKYANPAIARRELEQMLDGQIRACHAATDADPVPEAWTAAMERAASAGRAAYRDLLDTEGFVDFFETATPIAVIEELNLGSRPASRSGEREVGDLRTIPWVFAWTQARCILPGWYSLGTGLRAYLDDEDGRIDTLREMYAEWPFFRSMLDNAALALARTEMEIAASYADLADEGVRERVFEPIVAEYERTVELVRSITGRERLVDRPWLAEALERRNPYVDPLNRLQVDLLGTEDLSAQDRRTLRLTVQGIAAGMKNTG